MYIDLTAEVKANIIKDKEALVKAGVLKSKTDKIKSAVIEDAMLHFRVGTITSEQGRVYKSIHIVDEPSLLTYNRAKGTLLTIPMAHMLMRIISYKNGKMKENKILFATLYRDSGMEPPSDKKNQFRDREIIRRILDEWKEKGLIETYADVMSGRAYAGIQFQVSKG